MTGRKVTRDTAQKQMKVLLFCGKVCRIARNTRPVERCRINGIVARVAFHKSKCRAYVILNLAKFFLIAAPCQHVEVGTDRGQSL